MKDPRIWCLNLETKTYSWPCYDGTLGFIEPSDGMWLAKAHEQELSFVHLGNAKLWVQLVDHVNYHERLLATLQATKSRDR